MFYYQTFFLLQIIRLLDCSQQIPVLVSSQTAVKGGHGFEIAVRMDNLRGGDWGEIQNTADRVRSMYSKTTLIAYGCFYVLDIANIEIQT